MDFNHFSVQVQDIIQRAFVLAEGYRHKAVDTGHLLKALLDTPDSVVPIVFEKLGKITNDL